MDYYEKIRKLLKHRRLELNMMQTEVAEKADISNNFYSNIERGETKPSVETLIKICKALNLSLDEIIFEEGKQIKEIYAKEVLRDLENSLKGKDDNSIDAMANICNVLSRTLLKIKNKKE